MGDETAGRSPSGGSEDLESIDRGMFAQLLVKNSSPR
jgi:hypothetical protein